MMLTPGCRQVVQQQGQHLVIQVVLWQQCERKWSKILQKKKKISKCG